MNSLKQKTNNESLKYDTCPLCKKKTLFSNESFCCNMHKKIYNTLHTIKKSYLNLNTSEKDDLNISQLGIITDKRGEMYSKLEKIIKRK